MPDVHLSAAGLAVTAISLLLLILGIFLRAKSESRKARAALVLGALGTLVMAANILQAGFAKCSHRAGACPAPLTGAGYPCSNEGAICNHGNNPQGVKVCKTRVSKWWEFGDCTCDCENP